MHSRSQKKIRFSIAVIILLVSILPAYVFAQNKIIDSLVKQLPATKADTNRVILLNKIGFALYSTDYQKSLEYCEQANALALKLNYNKGLSLNLYIQGVVYTFKDDYATALIKVQQAASLALKINDFATLAKAYNAAGVAYSRLNDSPRALAAFNDAIAALKRTPDKSYHAAILHNMAVLYIEKKQYDRGLNDLFTAVQINQHSNNNQWLVQNYFWIGKAYFIQMQYPLALKYEAMTISLADQYHFYQPLVKALGVQGAINTALKKYKLAETQLLQGEKIASDKKISSEHLAILKSLADLYEQKNNLKQALAYQKKYHEDYESVFNAAKAKLVAEYQARFQDKQKYIENELLKKDRVISDANIEQRNLLLLITLLTILVLIVSTIVIYLAYYKIKQKNRQTEYQNRKIATQNAELENLNQLKDKLFSVLAHDLRGPLAILKQLLELHDQGVLDEEEEDIIRKRIIRDVDQNSDLINNLLMWGQSQLNGFTLSPKEFSVFELANQIVSQLKSDINSKEIVILNNINKDLIAFADKEMIDTVVRNLINNAIKFTPAKGTITVVAVKSNNEIAISVTDTGIGMSDEQAARLFKGDFYTTKTTLNPHGTGLGLQICKEFVEHNHGKIWVETELGKGSSFSFNIPMSSSAQPATTADTIL